MKKCLTLPPELRAHRLNLIHENLAPTSPHIRRRGFAESLGSWTRLVNEIAAGIPALRFDRSERREPWRRLDFGRSVDQGTMVDHV